MGSQAVGLGPGWVRHAQELDLVVAGASKLLLEGLARLPNGASEEDVLRVYFAVVSSFSKVAASSAYRAIDNARRVAGQWGKLAEPVFGGPVPVEQAQKIVSWALRKTDGVLMEEAFDRLSTSVERVVRNGARSTVYASTKAAGTRFARVPGPTACPFCLMLASRGAVYYTAMQAERVFEARHKIQDVGERYHDNCGCQAVESLTDYDLPEFLHDLNVEWHEVTKDYWGTEKWTVWEEHCKNTRPTGLSIKA